MVRNERGERKRVKCLLPSSSSIQRTIKCVEEITTETVPCELVAGSNGNIKGGFEFDIEKLFIHLITSYALGEKAKNGEVEIAIKYMEINYTPKLPIFPSASNLPTRIMCVQSPSKFVFEVKYLQSNKWCYPVKTILEKDNQETYEEHFDNKFSFVSLVHALLLNSRSPIRAHAQTHRQANAP
jgi:hypothetical protein